ncbi:cyclic AMP-responsive element-binding protein 1-like [Saccoglossus kowalevskii]|uniref:Cyclic AMP-responsive element-binding protein 1-like n=1 Tax=Saccoglossus kowalevskii TaxID=10224 RepID=A0ABM0MQ16_SACKO|nr:PREDICTED: cyclic AMP-responsive element-binding protein 1-like [Saccoglossus kowalevskii]
MESMVDETGGSVETDQSQVTTSQAATMVVTAIPNQPVQVQSVIQPSNQPSVIQTAPLQTVQVHVTSVQDSEDGVTGVENELDSRKRRDILSRRPSYRKILNDLSSDVPAVPKIDEETSSQEDNEAANNITTNATTIQTYQTTPHGGQTLQIVSEGLQQSGLQTLTMTNAGAAAQSTIVQYSQSQDGSQQFFVPTASGDIQAYQIRTSSVLPQGVIAQPNNMQTQQQLAEEASRKRELRLMKNREAARECRRKKKEYVKCLENRVAVLENQNKALIEELKALKDLYCHKSD